MSDVALLPYGLRKSFLKASELLRLLESFFFFFFFSDTSALYSGGFVRASVIGP